MGNTNQGQPDQQSNLKSLAKKKALGKLTSFGDLMGKTRAQPSVMMMSQSSIGGGKPSEHDTAKGLDQDRMISSQSMHVIRQSLKNPSPSPTVMGGSSVDSFAGPFGQRYYNENWRTQPLLERASDLDRNYMRNFSLPNDRYSMMPPPQQVNMTN